MANLEFQDLEGAPTPVAGTFGLVAIVLAVAFSVLLYVVGATRNSALKTAERRVQEINSQLASFMPLERQAKGLAAGVGLFNATLAKQVNWEAFWQEIAASQLKDIYYINFSVDDKQSVRLDGSAPSFVAVAKQMKSIDNAAAFSTVVVSQTSKEQDRLKFSVTFSFERAKLKAAK